MMVMAPIIALIITAISVNMKHLFANILTAIAVIAIFPTSANIGFSTTYR